MVDVIFRPSGQKNQSVHFLSLVWSRHFRLLGVAGVARNAKTGTNPYYTPDPIRSTRRGPDLTTRQAINNND